MKLSLAQNPRRRRWSLAWLIAACVAVGALVGTLVVPQFLANAAGEQVQPQALPVPTVNAFDCQTPSAFLAQSTAGPGNPTQLNVQEYTLGGSKFVPIGVPWTGIPGTQQRAYNAIGFNQEDGFLYGMSEVYNNGEKRQFLRIGAGGEVQMLGEVTGAPEGSFINIGSFFNGTYYFAAGDNHRVWKLDMDTLVATELNLSKGWYSADFTQAGNYLWGAYGSKIYRLDPLTGVVDNFEALSATPVDAGAAMTFGNGNLGFNGDDEANGGGQVIQVAVANPDSANPTFTVVSKVAGPSSFRNDGASCLPNPFDTDLGVTKTGTSATSTGGSLAWDITVTNHGPAISSGHTVTDTLPAGVTNVSAPNCTVAGSTITCTGPVLRVGESQKYHITANAPTADGTIRNTVAVIANENDTNPDNDRSFWDTNVSSTADPHIALTKRANPTSLSDAKVDDQISYTFEATNTGNTPLTGVTITDQKVGVSQIVPTWPNPADPGTLQPGEKATGTATYRVTAQDIAAGAVTNTATASGQTPEGTGVSADASARVTLATQTPGITLTKSADVSQLSSPPKAGDTVTYKFEATNSGNTALTGVAITDPLKDLSKIQYTWPNPAALQTLLPGEKVSGTATYQITQADIDNRGVTNTATVVGTSPSGTGVSATAKAEVLTPRTGGIGLTKSADYSQVSNPAVPDQTVTYTFVATNTGNTTLQNVTITDPLDGLSKIDLTWPGATGVLSPGQQVTGTATYKITQADIDKGVVDNEATAFGELPGGEDPTAKAAATVPLARNAALTFTKTADATAISTPPAVDDTITYSFVASNSGNVTLTGVTVTDPLAGLSKIDLTWPDPAAEGTLLPGQQVIGTATYTLKQTDLNRGDVKNTATATGVTPNGDTLERTSSRDVPLPAGAGIVLVKSASGAGLSTPAAVGDTVTYSFAATNSGNVPLTGVTVTDPKQFVAPIQLTWPGAAGVLGVGETVTGTASYVLTQEDLNAGHVENTASAQGVPPSGPGVTDSSSADVRLAPGAGISLVKSGVGAFSTPPAVKDVITYSFTATNTGNVPLTGVTITDPKKDLTRIVYQWPGAAGELGVGESVTGTATYEITQEDLNAGEVKNTASTTGTTPFNTTVTATDSATVSVARSSAITLTKSADTSKFSTPITSGDTITYTFVAQNTGNTTLTGVTVTDPLEGLSKIDLTWPDTNAQGTLLPGQSVTGTATYDIEQTDIDSGHVNNTATTSGSSPTGPVSAMDEADVTLAADSGLTLTKSADESQVSSPAAVGDTITYTFVATNTGNVTLTDVTVSDPLDRLSKIDLTWPDANAEGTLLPGQQVTGTATYTLEQADLDRGEVKNTATATGKTPSDTTIEQEASKDVTLGVVEGIDLKKMADDTKLSNPAKVGDVITYTFVAENTGTTTLTNVKVVDQKDGLSKIDLTWPNPAAEGTLLPGQKVTGTATYTLTQDDLDAGQVDNKATGEGTTPPGTKIDDEGEADVPLVTTPSLELAKTADYSQVSSPAKVDDTITYTFVAKNTGTVTLTDVTIADALKNLSKIDYTWPDPNAQGTLLPNQQMTATATYKITQEDLDAGQVKNKATGEGTTPSGTTVDDEAEAIVPLDVVDAIDLTKSADFSQLSKPAKVDEVITYTFVAENTGTTTLTNVKVVDQKDGLSKIDLTWPNPAAEGTLLPGQKVTGTATYTLTQDDLDAGQVDNKATGEATTPPGTKVDDEGEADVPLVTTQGIELTKTADESQLSSPAAVGDTIGYTFVATNTGTVTLTDVAITDLKQGLSKIDLTWPNPAAERTLLPGESVTGTATYTLTQDDLDSGEVKNTALGEGTTPSGTKVDDNGEADVTLVTRQGIDLKKTADFSQVSTPAVVGETITYTFVAENTGTTTLKNARVVDPKLGAAKIVYTWPNPAAAGTLLPGEKVTATATYRLTQADLDRGAVNNKATGEGTTPPGTTIDHESEADVPLVTVADIDFLKTADTSALSTPPAVGDTITYTFQGHNIGSVTLTGVAITDPLPGLSKLDYTWPNPAAPGVVAPGETVTAKATYRLTQAELDAGHLSNKATITVTPPSEPPTNKDSEVDTDLDRHPALQLAKTADVSGLGSPTRVGDTIIFRFVATNTGNVTMTNVKITDTMAGLSPLNYEWPGEIGVLAPGESMSATATYQVTQADIDAGHVANNATVGGEGPGGTGTVSRPAQVDTTMTRGSLPAVAG